MPDIKSKAEYEQYKLSVAEFIAHEELSFLSTGCADIMADEWEPEATAEPWFSWSPCECCGCHLGGNREYLYARDAQDILVEFEICEDCVYYIEYGRLDDTTMERVSTVAD